MITDVVSTLKNLLHHLDEEIEEHTRQRDFYVAALANETESPARASMQSSVLLHNEIIHTLWGCRPSRRLPVRLRDTIFSKHHTRIRLRRPVIFYGAGSHHAEIQNWRSCRKNRRARS